ncbi:peptidase S41A family [Carnimonas sp. R-84981]
MTAQHSSSFRCVLGSPWFAPLWKPTVRSIPLLPSAALSLILLSTAACADNATIRSNADDHAIPAEQMRLFIDAYQRIQQHYIEPVNSQQLITGAIRGMVAELDPHSAYLDAEQLAALRDQTSGSFSGVGMQLGLEQGHISVVSTTPHGPANKADIKPHDWLVAIDQQSTESMGLTGATDKLRGETGSQVSLTLRRDGSSRPFTITLARDRIRTDSVTTEHLNRTMAMVRIDEFQNDTGDELHNALEQLAQQPLDGLVLDLRGNPGGVLDAAVDVTSEFVGSGTVVYTQGRNASDKRYYHVTGHPSLVHTPLVVLIDGGTASAAEIVAGALQDHHRAVILGTDSYGKASVQAIQPLTDGSALKLTTARYYTPNGRSIQLDGIAPDVHATAATVEELNNDNVSRETNLDRHLNNPGTGSSEIPADETINPMVSSDFQLREAFNLLKGIKAVRMLGE